MKTTSTISYASWRRSRRCPAGLTLIEVVAAVALLGWLAMAITMARARSTRQRATADRRLQAVAAAESLLANWWQAPDAFPRRGTGVVPGATDLSWRTNQINSPAAHEAGIAIVRLELHDRQRHQTPTPWVVVDVALAEPPHHDQTSDEQ